MPRDDEKIRSLQAEIAELRARLDAQARTLASLGERLSALSPAPQEAVPAPPVQPPPPMPTQAFPAPVTARQGPAPGPDIEANIVGKWFPRIGAIAVLIGAGFAFKFAIDRGYISPAVRVSIGIAVGLAFIAWGQWAYRRGWLNFSQAISGGGLALIYLSLLAGLHLYDLISPGTAFALLIATALGGAGLAVLRDSLPLAVLATVGAFLNPFLIGGSELRASPILTYSLLVDVGVVTIAYFRSWRALDVVAMSGTWIVFAVAADAGRFAEITAFGSAFFLLFFLVAVSRLVREGTATGEDTVLIGADALAFFALLAPHFADDSGRGIFTLFLALFFFLALVGLRPLERDQTRLTSALSTMAASSLAVSIGFLSDGFWRNVLWSAESVLLLWVGAETPYRHLRRGGALLLLFSAVTLILFEFRVSIGYRPDALIFSGESLAMLVHVVALYIAAAWMANDDSERSLSRVLGVLASAATVVWFSFEAVAHYRRKPGADAAALNFSLSAIWALYGGAALAAGFLAKVTWPRFVGVAVLGITMVKIAAVDLWFLSTGYRILVFMGIGAILLTGSLMYHRFKELIVGPDLEEAPAER